MSLIVADARRRWVNGVIPFKDHSSIAMEPSGNLPAVLAQARQAWEANTPIRFVPQTTESDYIEFKWVLGLRRCSSHAGRKGGMQEVKCSGPNLRSIVHELGHAIGLKHEHQRADRDVWMAVSAAAIARLPQDFARQDGEQMVGGYDLNSVMHYAWSTPANATDLTKISPIPPAVYSAPTTPSAGDLAGVCFMYGIVPALTPIACLRRTEDTMEVWCVGADGVARGAWFDGEWHTWYQLHGRTFPVGSNLAVISRHEGHMELFGIDTNGFLCNISWNGSWGEWTTIGFPPVAGAPPGTATLQAGAAIAARSRFRDHMEVWAVATDGQVWATWWDGDWRAWYPLPLPGGDVFPVGAPIAIHCRTDDYMEIWAVDTNAQVRGNWWNGSWMGWYALPTPGTGPFPFRFPPGAQLAVVGRNDDHMELWGIGGDDRLHGIWWDGDWHDWYTLPGRSCLPGGPLVAVARNDDHMEVWVAADTNRLCGVWWDGDWHSWYDVDPLPVTRGTPLAALSRSDEHMEVWCVAPHGAPVDEIGVQGVWWDGSNWQGFYRVT
jgi:hypothetical protein